ncbi:MAG: VanZ family protein [Candidatus Omnitrophota bacterium]|jgi:VanZ family protein
MNIKTPSFLRGWPPAILWMALIFGLSSIPGSDFPEVPVPEINSIVHAIEYSILGVLLLRGFTYSFPGKPVFRLVLFAAGSAILFGLSDEWHQTFVQERFFELQDLIVDAISAVLGILLYIRKTELSLLTK